MSGEQPTGSTGSRPRHVPDPADLLPAPAWGHAGGYLELVEVSGDGNRGATDRELIVERLHRYCWCYDERRLDLLRACFSEDAVWEGSVMGRIAIGPIVGIDEIETWLAGFWPYQHDQRRHMILNTVILSQDAGSAELVAYVLLMSARDAVARVETMGFYRVQAVKSGEGWLIQRLFGGFDAPFWPGQFEELSARARARHGILDATSSSGS